MALIIFVIFLFSALGPLFFAEKSINMSFSGYMGNTADLFKDKAFDVLNRSMVIALGLCTVFSIIVFAGFWMMRRALREARRAQADFLRL